ncbi:MAG: hypothetical protein K9L82_05435 [Chromatiaceae bacterium]|nr:hypothetical protein [Chromatiaceae bacterium]
MQCYLSLVLFSSPAEDSAVASNAITYWWELGFHKRSLADALLEGTDDSSRLSYAEMLALVQDSGGE